MAPTVERARNDLAERLRARRAEIEQAMLTRAYAISDPTEAADPTYAEGLRAAVSAAIDYGLAGIEAGGERPPPVPDVLLTQARFAARNGVSLDTVLRRYFAGYTLLGDFMVEECQQDGLLEGPTLKRLLRAQAALFDRLVAAVTEEHSRESENRPGSTEQRRAEHVERLLAGELLETSALQYDFNAHHLGAIAVGLGVADAFRDLALALDRRLLLIRRGGGVAWAWLGGRRGLDPTDLEHGVSSTWPPQVPLAIGEPGQGLAGWRLTHRQAAAALPIALRGPEAMVRYADVALLAMALRDDLLATSLEKLYLEPLTGEQNDGATLRQTLHAYFAAGRNASSAAATLGVSRQTINSRLRAIEEKIARPLETCAAELETAMSLQRLSKRQIR
jgi:PucR C-terminal helix-turn-helix domain/GGDEF-like domain